MRISLQNSFFRLSNARISVRPVTTPSGQVVYVVSELLTTTGAGTWTKPEGITSVTVECWAGGGGGGGSTINDAGGGGGGGGAYARKIITYGSTSQNISYTVGAGGTTGTGAGGNGGDSTWETNVVIAEGGKGGATGIADGAFGGDGGLAVNSVGDIKYNGGSGNFGFGNLVVDASCAGGGGAGSTGDGGNGVDNLPNGGIGTSEFGGNGGNGTDGTVNFTGLPGSNYGGGGSGAMKISGQNRSGGVGAQGLIRVSYTIPPPLDIYTGSNAAYSIRQLSSTATYSMRVRRSNDSAELDIGFQADGMLDTGSLTTFVGANTGYVAKWYDQTGGGYHMTPFSGTETTWAAIVKSGTLQTENGKPALRFDGGQAYISEITTQEYTTAGGLWFQFGVCKVDDANTRVLSKVGNITVIAQAIRRGATSMEAIGYNSVGGTGTDANGVSPGTSQVITYTQRTSTNIEIYMNGTSNGATTVTGTPATEATPSVMALGAFNPSTLSNAWLGSVQEIIHFPQDPDTLTYRSNLTTILNSYYGTF